ncbi:hypothetical protein [Thiohalocapsa sp. ML1]|jgi:hypothetical protein|uniref:hypothetical protein n=1 Tax=Thiohalocapsa sp. ML1 TaxID=1431688 RepID=UPI0015701E5E|nr:hypothetical protein [Thiohalocapsa sp. ML1]
MVNRTIVSRFAGDLPLAEGAPRKIPGGPLYPAAEVLALLEREREQGIQPWTRKCKSDAQRFGLDLHDLCVLLEQALRSGRFRDSEWCQQGSDGPWAACDAYQLLRQEWIENAHKHMTVEYYLKFALARTGRVLLLVSCHLSENW